MTSLPVPVSPIMSTVAVVGAMVLISSKIFSIFGLRRAKVTGTGWGIALTGLIVSIVGVLLGLLIGLSVFIWFMRDISGWVDESYREIRDGNGPTPSELRLPLSWRVPAPPAAVRLVGVAIRRT